MAISNYYVPSSMSRSYVANKRNEDYSPTYLSAKQNIDIEKQGALQNLEKTYATTIDNAYASYLANQRNINMSAMGEGYKNLYREMQEEQLQSNLASNNLEVSKARQEIEAQAATAKAGIQKAEDLEVSNLNRVQSTMQQYLNYVKSLTGEEGMSPLTEEQQNMYIDDLYETLYNLPVKGYTDEKGGQALSYTEWVRSNLTGSEADTAWGDWLYSGGLQDFMKAVAKTRAAEKKEDTELKDYIETKPTTGKTTEASDVKLFDKNISGYNKVTYLDADGNRKTASIIKRYDTSYDDYEMSMILKKANLSTKNLKEGMTFEVEGKKYIVAIPEHRKNKTYKFGLYEIN